MAYRDAPMAAPKRSSGGGVVDEMVRQFADRHAFVRELVQNAIDAGATRIEVSIERRGDGSITTSVDDDGNGMTRAIIEGPLLTLFSSSKEDDPNKIGKYGVGFVSVFATEPEKVEVFTWRPEGAWRVRLFGDHTYELETESAQPGHGTVVSLSHRFGGEDAERYVSLTIASLERWCRHAHVPIALSIDGARTVINRALELDALVSHSVIDGADRIVVGVGVAFAGYYNRGLTLFESAGEVELAGFGFKIDSPTLGHTISRDNVKRDRAFGKAFEKVKAIVVGPLRDAMHARFGEAAADGDLRTCDVLLATMPEPDPKRLAVPLFHGSTTIAKVVAAPSIIVAAAPSPLTEALERRGIPVVRGFEFAPILRRFSTNAASADVDAWSLAVPVDADTDPLLVALHKALRAADTTLARVRFGQLFGARSGDTFRWASAPDGLTAAHEIETRGLRSSTLFLNVDDAAIRLARKKPDVGVAAHILARIVLLETGPLSKHAVDALLQVARG